jgi:DNA modification methylase
VSHRIINGDCTHIMPTLERESFDVVYADPPYNVSTTGKVTRRLFENGTIPSSDDLPRDFGEWDHYTPEEYAVFTRLWMQQAADLLKVGGTMYVWWPTDELYVIKQLAAEVGLTWMKPVFWVKSNPSPNLNTMSRYVTSLEAAGWMCKEKVSYFKGGAYRLNYTKASIPHHDRIHSTQKSTEVVTYHLETSLPPAGRLLDPFMGSGVSLVGAEILEVGATAIGLEKDADMCRVASMWIDRELDRLRAKRHGYKAEEVDVSARRT